MKLMFGIFLVVFAGGLFLLNLSLGTFHFTESLQVPPFAESFKIPSFSFKSSEEGNTVLDTLVEKIDEGRQNLTVQEVQKKVTSPTPIKVFQQSATGQLDKVKVQLATNVHREQNGLPALVANATLDEIAQAKIDDMFALQYFEHESPTGILFTDLAEQYGYEYIAMGENLALGGYENETALVQAWMDSPGHRANILHEAYQEIGIAVQRGSFEGQDVWLAVQTFGLPVSACPAPEEVLKSEIEAKKLELKELEALVDVSKQELDAMQPKRGKAYQDKVAEFNTLVQHYNATVTETQNLIVAYNIQVDAFNACADG